MQNKLGCLVQSNLVHLLLKLMHLCELAPKTCFYSRILDTFSQFLGSVSAAHVQKLQHLTLSSKAALFCQDTTLSMPWRLSGGKTKITVNKVASKRWHLSFIRWLSEERQEELRKLKDILKICLNDQEDTPVWNKGKNGCFSVKSVYKQLCESESDCPTTKIWSAKIPLKIKIFMWLTLNGAIRTNDVLVRKSWKGNKTCAFCTKEESIMHLFFECDVNKYVWSTVAWSLGANCRPSSFDQYERWINHFMPNRGKFHIVGISAICWAIWKLRNKMCFEKKLIHSPTEIVCYACVFLTYWAGLQKEVKKRNLETGAKILKNNAVVVHPKQEDEGRAQAGTTLVITDGSW